jgi:hypothetical protein
LAAGAQIWHQPAGLIGPATILQRLAGALEVAGLKMKYTHCAQTCPLRGTS